MLALNRSAIVVRPKPPFLEWLHTADPTSVTLTLADLGREPTIYLVSECDDPEDEQACLRPSSRPFSTISWTAGGGIGRRGPRLVPWTSSRAGLIASSIRRCST